MERSPRVLMCTLLLNVFFILPLVVASAAGDVTGEWDVFWGDTITCVVSGDNDADDDGIADMDEDANHNGVVDINETDPCSPDTDGDGVQDGTEIGLTLGSVGPDTDLTVFVPDQDPASITDPLSVDTDNDGLTDGEEDSNLNGRLDGLAGEHDPLVSDSYLYDGFTSVILDPDKWDRKDKVREIRNGSLFSSVGGRTLSEGLLLNQTVFRNAESINAIEADITYLGGQMLNEDTFQIGAQLEGVFYSDTQGKVGAGITIGDRGEGPEAWWYVVNGAGIGYGESLPVMIEKGVKCRVKIAYDQNINRFTFSVNGVEHTFNSTPWVSNDYSDFKALTTGVWGNEDSGMGSCAALFDNIKINGEQEVYEDFEAPLMDDSRWEGLETVRTTSHGQWLDLGRRAVGATKLRLIKFENNSSKYFRADIKVDDDSTSAMGLGLVGVGEIFYNDTYNGNYNGLEGDVSASVYLSYGDAHSLRAVAYLKRIEEPDRPVFRELFSMPFEKELVFGQPNTVSVELIGSTVQFRCNDEVIQYEIQGALYPPYSTMTGIKYGVLADGGEGYLKATVDSVATVHDVPRPYDFDYNDDNDVDGMDLAIALQEFSRLTENRLKYLSHVFGAVLPD